jgi:hypothetical protein
MIVWNDSVSHFLNSNKEKPRQTQRYATLPGPLMPRVDRGAGGMTTRDLGAPIYGVSAGPTPDHVLVFVKNGQIPRENSAFPDDAEVPKLT